MGIIVKVDSSDIFETFQDEKSKNIRTLEETLNKLKISSETKKADDLEDKLSCLKLEDDDKKLIERGPITSKDTKLPKTTFYQRARRGNYQEIVSNIHHCGSLLYYSNDSWHQVLTNNNSRNFNINNDEGHANKCRECADIFDCNECILKLANSEEFSEFVGNQIQSSDLNISNEHTYPENSRTQIHFNIERITQSESNILNIQNINQTIDGEPKLNILNISQPKSHTTQLNIIESSIQRVQEKPMIRRISHDSGIGCDTPSPLSDFAPSPASTSMPPPTKQESTMKCRSIRPKQTQAREKKLSESETDSTRLNVRNSRETETSEVQKQILVSTLNPTVRKEKWIDYIVQKDAIFKKGSDGKTILHELLNSKEKYIEESFYTIVELMKQSPAKCTLIIEAQTSICKAITDNNFSQILMDYFVEAVEIIRNKQQTATSNAQL